MGLAAVLGIVRMHRGSVLVQSEPERGTTMTVLIPLSGAPVVAAPVRALSDEDLLEWQGTGQILLADDEPGVRRVATRMLDKLGFDVILAEDGLQAVEIFHAQRNSIDIVILDLTMPRLGGQEACARIRQMDPGVPIILSSGYTEQEIQLRDQDPGPSAFIPKPYTLKRLRRILNEVAPSRTFR
jgi:CheY-like chemotaxis protein